MTEQEILRAAGPSPARTRLRTSVPILASFVLLVAVVVATAALVGIQSRNDAELRRIIDLRRHLTGLFSGLQDAETGQRGYLLTGSTVYLQPYDAAMGSITERTAAIDANAGTGLEADIATLKRLAADKLAELKETVDLYRAGRTDEALLLVRTDRGKAVMDEIRSVVERMRTENYRFVVERQERGATAATWLQAAVAVAVVLVTLLGTFVLIDAGKRTRRMARSQGDLEAANRALVETAARRDLLEEQLRQSQKMEAMGQLTGGMAHDFNNMLAIIMGNLNLMKRRLDGSEIRLERYIDNALEGAERAANLTRRLLAFARKQPLQPEPLACNRLIADMSDMIRRSLGETVRVETVLAAGLWQTRADANQLESALINLAVNARDAMADGGRLTIETANVFLDEAYAALHSEVAAGQYVMIAVSDNGSGMKSDTAMRAFDPFFTTKAVGRGTGLGLSQVHGFVKQSGGHVKIYSEPGRGTTVKIYLSRLLGLDKDIAPVTPVSLPEGHRREIILVVEDEEDVRKVAVEALRDLNYTVIHAEGALGALQLLDRYPDVSLLFTDVVMPDIDGRKLADEARRLRPDLQVLYTTGYSRNAIVHNGIVDAGVRLLGKPYTLEQLALQVRQAITQTAA